MKKNTNRLLLMSYVKRKVYLHYVTVSNSGLLKLHYLFLLIKKRPKLLEKPTVMEIFSVDMTLKRDPEAPAKASA